MKFAPSQNREHFDALFKLKDGAYVVRDDRDMVNHLACLCAFDDIDFNFQDEGYNSPLFVAVENSNFETVKFLIEEGASTAFAASEAFHRGNKEVLQRLFSLGAEISDPLYRKANSLLTLKAREMSAKEWFLDKANFKKDNQSQCAELIKQAYEKQHPQTSFRNKMYI